MISASRVTAALLAVLALALFAPLAFAQEGHSSFELDRVVPGATGTDLRAVFGDPLLVQRDAEASIWREDFALVARGYAQVTAWFDERGTLACARVVPVTALKPVAAGLLFDLRSGASRSDGHGFAGTDDGHFLHHKREGVHFFIEAGRVHEIWRTAPGVLPGDIVRTIDADYPVRPLPEKPRARTSDPADSDPTARPPGAVVDVLPSGETARSLWMEKPTVAIVLDSEFHPQLAVTAVVFANGLLGEQIRFEGRIHPFSGKLQSVAPLAASAQAPAGLRDQGGFLHPRSTDTVQFDTSRFGTPTLLFPLRFLESFDSNFSGHFQVSFEVSCGGLLCFDTAVASVPGPRLPDIGSIPTIKAGKFQFEAGELDPFGPGLWVDRDIETKSARGHQVGTYLFLRYPDGRHVQAAAGWENWRLNDGRFYASVQDKALYDASSWSPFRIFLPFAALDLKPGEQTLILRVQSSIGALGGAHEREISIEVPEAMDRSGRADKNNQRPGGSR